MSGTATGKPPVFLAGAGRSGTTLLRVILDSHPHIACGPEFKMIPGIAGQWADTVTAHAPVMASYKLSIGDVNRAYRELIETLLSSYLAASGKQRLAEKSPNNIFFLPHLAHIFPGSPLIHVIRDGRDVVASLLTMDWVDPATGGKIPYVESAEAAATYWVHAVTAGRTAASENPVRERYLETRYEDIVRQPEQTLRKLFAFIDEPWDPVVLDFYRVKRDLAGESSAEQVRQPLTTSAAGRWKTDLDPRDRATVKDIAGPLLIELGYAEDNDW